jgi:hypothetical protein
MLPPRAPGSRPRGQPRPGAAPRRQQGRAACRLGARQRKVRPTLRLDKTTKQSTASRGRPNWRPGTARAMVGRCARSVQLGASEQHSPLDAFCLEAAHAAVTQGHRRDAAREGDAQPTGQPCRAVGLSRRCAPRQLQSVPMTPPRHLCRCRPRPFCAPAELPAPPKARPACRRTRVRLLRAAAPRRRRIASPGAATDSQQPRQARAVRTVAAERTRTTRSASWCSRRTGRVRATTRARRAGASANTALGSWALHKALASGCVARCACDGRRHAGVRPRSAARARAPPLGPSVARSARANTAAAPALAPRSPLTLPPPAASLARPQSTRRCCACSVRARAARCRLAVHSLFRAALTRHRCVPPARQRPPRGAVHRRHQAAVPHPRQDAQEGLGQHGACAGHSAHRSCSLASSLAAPRLRTRPADAHARRATSSSWVCATTRTRRRTLS